MTSAPKHFPLSLLSLGLVLLVSACGGGDALPPGSATVVPAAPAADTVPPVLTTAAVPQARQRRAM